MNAIIKHTVQKGETLESIAFDYGLSVSQLKIYHNSHITNLKEHIGYYVKEGTELLMENEKTPKPPLQIKETSKEDTDREKRRQNKKEIKKTGKEEYFIVDGAKCLCDRGTLPATLKVNSHTKSIFNSMDSDRWVATLEDIQFQEGNSCFGNCAANNNSFCSFTPVGLWQKPFEKVKVIDKKVLVESSFLMCALGGKISIEHHGQTIKIGKSNLQRADPEILNQVLPGLNLQEYKAEVDNPQYYI